jgi:hypothetical protein
MVRSELVVFPALREKLEPHRVHLIDIDLYWAWRASRRRTTRFSACACSRACTCCGQRWPQHVQALQLTDGVLVVLGVTC